MQPGKLIGVEKPHYSRTRYVQELSFLLRWPDSSESSLLHLERDSILVRSSTKSGDVAVVQSLSRIVEACNTSASGRPSTCNGVGRVMTDFAA